MDAYLFPSLFCLVLCAVFVWLAVRRMRAGKPLRICLWLPSPSIPQEVTNDNKKPPAFPNADG
ncbi:hypothetical protein [uncultured Akkermansia sp.]|uniref:hypothetical protein n=1 Tax=uncultured Akkermansia sp. TaxID=512294 RepID=UPI00262D1C27|nr:hypothetical protein [uncultured Akkermansia sp.]